MRKLIHKILPPDNWKMPVIIALGIFIGLSVLVFKLSKAHSYLSDDPKTCVNCHIMAPQYATWNHSSHREWTNCNDCHVPHDNVANKYFFKAKDGLRHSTMFALRLEPQVIKMHEAGQGVVQKNCIRCHSNTITDSKLLMKTDKIHSERSERQCWSCHREVPHGRVHSLTSVPNAKGVPLPESPVPDWIKNRTKK